MSCWKFGVKEPNVAAWTTVTRLVLAVKRALVALLRVGVCASSVTTWCARSVALKV